MVGVGNGLALYNWLFRLFMLHSEQISGLHLSIRIRQDNFVVVRYDQSSFSPWLLHQSWHIRRFLRTAYYCHGILCFVKIQGRSYRTGL